MNPPTLSGQGRASPPRTAAPLVSVIIPAYDGVEFIEFTLASLAAQTYPNLEWVVIDDASHDRTAEVVTAFLARSKPGGRLVRHERNVGLSRSLNDGLRETSGEFVLILQQDIVLLSPEWIERAVADFDRSPALAVVTGYYGLPAPGETTFVQRAFGVLRRQFHWPRTNAPELATFTEFKCDLVRRSSLAAIGGFPEQFRIAGEDAWISYSLGERGERILKDFDLKCVQRFTGDATSLRGNLRKEFLFGKVIAATVTRFRSRLMRGLRTMPYSRSRSLNRASQPLVLLAILILALFALFTRNEWVEIALLAVVVGRLVYYVVRLAPGLVRITGSTSHGAAEALAGAFLGLASDAMYSAGLLVGLLGGGRASTE
jgi:glycosyltransferase involved in cell wall biosynthesis